jgi:hypothetical protein
MTCDGSVPIACSLDAAGLEDRIAEWRAFARDVVVDAEYEGTAARFLLTSDDGTLARAASLSQREKECCPFFEFAIELEPSARWLRVSVPPDATEALSLFVEMLAVDVRA